MTINLQNYEEYFVRYIDDELSPQEVSEVNRFLQEHPELKQELEAFRSVILPLENEIRFSGKENLKRGITAANRDEYFVKKIEGDLSPEEEKELAEFLHFNPQFNHDLKLFEATKLSADTSIVFPNKKSLKKGEGRIVPIGIRYLLTVAVAASLIAVVLLKGIPWNQPAPSTQTAQQNQIKNENNDESANTKTSTARNEEGTSNKNSNDLHNNSLPEKNVGEKKAQANEKREKKSLPKKESSPTLIADASLPSSQQTVNNSSSNEMERESELMPISTSESQGIYYLPKQKKAVYRANSEAQAQFASERNTPNAGSIAASLGSDLLRLSGRGDYLPDSYNDQRNKGPLALSIGNDKFGFSTTLFKKRAEKNSSPDKTKTVL